MITAKNYHTEIPPLHGKLPDALSKSHELVDKVTQGGTSWESYENNPTIKRVVDLYFTKLNEWLATQKRAKPLVTPERREEIIKAKQEAEKAVKRERKEKKPGVKKEKSKKKEKAPKVLPGTPVERITEELRFIRRYVNMNGRKKSHDQILNLINGLQKAILERRIRKGSPYAKEIEHIQEQLILAHDKLPYNGSAQVNIEGKMFDRLKEIATSEGQMYSIRFLKRYVGIHGKPNVKIKAEKLLKDIGVAIEKEKTGPADTYFKQVKEISESLRKYIGDSAPELKLYDASLNGQCVKVLCGLGGWEWMLPVISGGITEGIKTAVIEESLYQKRLPQLKKFLSNKLLGKGKSLAGVMTIEQVKNSEFKPIYLVEKWRNLIGEACAPTNLFVYGKGGSGKSSFALQFADHLSATGYKFLYVAGEQFGTPAFTHLLNTAGIKGNENFLIAKDFQTLNPADFDFVVLDSKDSLYMNVDNFREAKKRYPNVSFIIISQGKKDGDFRGNESWRNEVDTLIHCDKGIARTNDKNRWGGRGELTIFSK